MADPISAIGLAACAIQFVDYGFKFISTTVKIYQSATGDLDQQNELRIIAEALQAQSKTLASQLSSNDLAMAEILESCVAVSVELQDVIARVTRSISSTSSKTITNSAITAFRAMMKSNKIKELEARFVRLREQLCFQLLATMYEHRSCTESALTELIGAQKAFHHLSVTRLERIIRTLEDLKKSSSQAVLSFSQQDGETFPQEPASGSFSKFADMFTAFAEERKKARVQAIIKGLQFPQITERETSILDAHKTTFEWAFSQDKSNLAEWLSGGSGIYWVSGKAGSGKSTLLKFLTGHQRTEKMLEAWSGGKTLVTASHFFWALGTTLQKSHQGLLQTLVCQILQKHPELVSVVSPTRWSSWTDIQGPWSLFELSKCLQSMASTRDFRVCLFIDGLDEYQGDHQELVEALQALTSSEDIKICASSRPWVEFTSAFGSGHWKLQVQDLTRQDISKYSSDKLKSHKDIGSYGSEVDAIAQEISLRAQGVFLWVYLVVRSLIRGMRYMDTIEDLWARLKELPTDLEEYFGRMLDSIEPIYRKRTARALRVLSQTESEINLPLITFYFMDLEMKNPDYAFGPLESPRPGHESEFYTKLEYEKKHQIVAQCRDLVHVHEVPTRNDQAAQPPWSRSASFLHRTVADFLMTSEVNRVLVSRSGDDFDPRMSICRSFLAQVKIMNHIEKTGAPSQSSRGYWDILRRDYLIPSICANARNIERVQGRTERRILDSLAPYFSLGRREVKEIFSQACPDFLNLAIRLGLSIYAKEYLKAHKDQRNDALVAALMKPMNVKIGAEFDMGFYDELNLDMARHVLELGVDPNAPADTKNEYHMAIPVTIWSQFLHQCMYDLDHERRTGCSTETAFNILHLLLSHGAMPTSVEWDTLKSKFSSQQFNELKFAWENSINKTTTKRQSGLGASDRHLKVESGSEEGNDMTTEQRLWEIESESYRGTGKTRQPEVGKVESKPGEERDKVRKQEGNTAAGTLEVRDDSEGEIHTGQVDVAKPKVQNYHTSVTAGKTQALQEVSLPTKEVEPKRRRGIWKWIKRK